MVIEVDNLNMISEIVFFISDLKSVSISNAIDCDVADNKCDLVAAFFRFQLFR